jgi:hypothetical protein
MRVTAIPLLISYKRRKEPKKQNEKTHGGKPPNPPKKECRKKHGGVAPKPPLSPRGRGWGKNRSPHPSPKRICSAAVNPFNRHKKTRKRRAIYTIKGYDRTRAAVSLQEKRVSVHYLKNQQITALWFLGF